MSDAQKVLFICTTQTHVRTFAPVAKSLSNYHIECSFISLDTFYDLNAESAIDELGLAKVRLEGPFKDENWWNPSDNAIGQKLELAKSAVGQLLSELKPSAIVVGNDSDPVEQLFIRSAEHHSIHTCRIQDGLIDVREIDDRSSRDHTMSTGDGGCELNFVWDFERASRQNQKDLCGRSIATGNPRYDAIAKRFRYQKGKPPYTVLLTTQSFTKLRKMTLGEEIALYREMLLLLLKREDVEVKVKLHPHTTDTSAYESLIEEFAPRVTLESTADSLDSFKGIDVHVTHSSTTAVESSLLGIPTARLAFLTLNAEGLKNVRKEAFLAQYLDADFPLSVDFGERSEKELVQTFSRPIDGHAARRVTQGILSLIRDEEISERRVKLAVVIESDTPTPISAVKAMLREKRHDFQLIVADRSTTQELRTELLNIDDARLFLVDASGQSEGHALNLAVAQTTAPYILRLGESALLSPGTYRQFYLQLKDNPSANACFGWYAWRNPFGIAEQIHSTPRKVTMKMMLEDMLFPNLCTCFAVTREALHNAGGFPASFPDANWFEQLVENPNDPSKIALLTAPVFFLGYKPLPSAQSIAIP